MQTRRDQLQAYRFQNRRALAALVTGEPNVVEPPMRRLTVMTIAGLMIAVLVAVVFALLGKFSPDTGDAWKDAGSIIIEQDTGAIYLYAPATNELHPVLNYASAVLAIQGNAQPHVVNVTRDDIKSAQRGYPVGIPGLPATMPPKSGLVGSPWSVCSTQQVNKQSSKLFARTTVNAGSDGGARALPSSTPVLVRGVKGGSSYVLLDHQRFAVNADVAASLQLNQSPVSVGTAFLDGIPAGPPLRAPLVPGAGEPSRAVPTARVGQLVRATDTQQIALVMRDGLQRLTDKVQAAILQTVRVGQGSGRQLPQQDTTENVILSNGSPHDGPQLTAALKNIPTVIGTPSPAAQRAGGVCAVYRSSTVTFAVPPVNAPTFAPGRAIESATSAGGTADDVLVPADGAALIKSSDGATTIFVVAPPGEKYAVTDGSVLSSFGYDGAKPTALPSQLLAIIPKGPALDPSSAGKAARR